MDLTGHDLIFLVSHEAISTGNPEILSLVLQHRDFQRGSQRLAGIPELLEELNSVSQVLFFKYFNLIINLVKMLLLC